MIKISNCTAEEFVRQSKKKKVICFCAGKKSRELCAKYQLEENLLYIVDNYAKDMMKAGKREIPIRQIEEIGEEAKECILLLTSMKYADEIIEQLDANPFFDDLEVYVPDLFTEARDSIELSAAGKAVIPKQIHYCWFGGNEMPERFQRNIETWRKYCPDYEIIKWDESNYDISKNLYMKQAYEAGKWGFVPDYARLDIINRYGGIYFDTDVEVLKPLDSLLQFNLFCGFETSEYIAFGLGFGAVKDNPILQAMMEEYENKRFIFDDGRLNLVASPTYQTEVLERYGLIRNGKTQMGNGFMALSSEYLSPVNSLGIGSPTARSFTVHQFAATWFDSEQQKEKNRLMNNYKYIISRMEKKG